MLVQINQNEGIKMAGLVFPVPFFSVILNIVKFSFIIKYKTTLKTNAFNNNPTPSKRPHEANQYLLRKSEHKSSCLSFKIQVTKKCCMSLHMVQYVPALYLCWCTRHIWNNIYVHHPLVWINMGCIQVRGSLHIAGPLVYSNSN